MVTELAERFPNVTVIDAAAAVRQAQDVIDQLIDAVQFVFLFALVAGLLVLYSALVATEDERRREAAVMRVYGASRAQVTGTQRAEFLAMGAIAGVLATIGAAIIGQMLARRVFELDLPPSPALCLAGPAAGLALLSLNALDLLAQSAARLARAYAKGAICEILFKCAMEFAAYLCASGPPEVGGSTRLATIRNRRRFAVPAARRQVKQSAAAMSDSPGARIARGIQPARFLRGARRRHSRAAEGGGGPHLTIAQQSRTILEVPGNRT